MKIVKLLVLVALLAVPPFIFYGGMVQGSNLMEQIPALYTPPLVLFYASEFPVEDPRGLVYELGFEEELWGSTSWFFLVDREASQDEMRGVLAKLDEYINNTNYPLTPTVTEDGRIFAFDEYNVMVYGKNTVAGNIVFLILFVILAVGSFIMMKRMVGAIVDILTTKKEDVSQVLKV